MGKSTSINPNHCFQHSTQISLCIHFWKWQFKNYGDEQRMGRKYGIIYAVKRREDKSKVKVALGDALRRGDAFAKMAIITSEHCKRNVTHHQISAADIEAFNAQYPTLTVRYNETFHDRFFIIDDKELYLINAPKKRAMRFVGEIRRRRTRRALKRPRASLKDLGVKCFGFTKMDSAEIPRIRKAAFAQG